jgi:hypothetical protein
MKNLISFLLILISISINAQSVIKVSVTTGGDDLRGGGNMAYLTVNYADGTTSPEYSLGGGFANNSVVVKSVTLNKLINGAREVKNVVIRHNGSPRAGQPYDTYDNWNLQTLRIDINTNTTPISLINESGNPLVRFTGQLRNRTFVPKTGGPEPQAPSTSKIKVFLTTGSDDLRGGGNSAYITIIYADGTASPEYNLGGGFGQNSLNTKPITLSKTVADISEIKSVTIRHNGSPRAGQPFDTYDNWDLQSLRVALIYSNGSERNVVNINGNPLVRFTGALRTQTFNR